MPRSGPAADGSFRAGSFNVLADGNAPENVLGLKRYRAGTTDNGTILSYQRGMTWLKVVATDDAGAMTADPSVVEEIRLANRTYVYYRPAGESLRRQVDVYRRGGGASPSRVQSRACLASPSGRIPSRPRSANSPGTSLRPPPGRRASRLRGHRQAKLRNAAGLAAARIRRERTDGSCAPWSAHTSPHSRLLLPELRSRVRRSRRHNHAIAAAFPAPVIGRVRFGTGPRRDRALLGRTGRTGVDRRPCVPGRARPQL